MDRTTGLAKNKDSILAFAQVGDLHITRAREQNYVDFLSIVSQIESTSAGLLDFVFLPGDNADNGLPEQYKLVAIALKMLSLPVQIIAGDHDMEQGDLTHFYRLLAAKRLPASMSVRGCRCIFADVCGPGKGGPDFRLGIEQLTWLEHEMNTGAGSDEKIILFMHTYPDDLADHNETDALNALIASHEVLLVAMGHTHYNEIANDGHTVFSATRSTGQIEEGPVGYAIVTVDNGSVGWRFKQLHDAFPFVVITSPADFRLMRDNIETTPGITEVRAIVFGSNPIKSVSCRINDQPEIPMIPMENGRYWQAKIGLPALETHTISVEAIDESGRPGFHAISVAASAYKTPVRKSNGSDAASIGAWPENGIFGSQLGPNRNGKPS